MIKRNWLVHIIIKVNAVSETKTYKKLFSMKNMLSTYKKKATSQIKETLYYIRRYAKA